MMRKLAVTVFAMSLTLVGCGSSSSSKKDTGADAQTTTDAGKLDVTPISPDTNPVNTDTGPLADAKVVDTAVTDTAVTDAVKLDVSGDVTPSDARDGSTSDVLPKLDVKLDVGAKLDTNPDTSIITTPDAPADSAPVNGDADDSEAGSDAE